MAKGRSGTIKPRISSPIGNNIVWEWLQPTDPDQSGQISAWDRQKRRTNAGFGVLGSIKQNMREMFLPVGYPDSVHSCYKRFHLWLGLETYVGSAIGVLCSQAMLASLGLGTMEAAGGAVAIQWVLKDGIGEVGKLFFIKRYASSFDSHPKTWKFVSQS
ncbi:vitamin B6 photo-protection and homoeostasis-domain-containing protein [Phycomyces nitens]|nr:vitamin B6 photo-protection and homoeostasis-domain-containing protein [Phycomyces nitens]